MTYPFLQLLQDVHLDESLLVKTLLVTDDLDSDEAAGHVVDAANDLAERAFAKDVNDFVSEAEVVPNDNGVITTFVIVSMIACIR